MSTSGRCFCGVCGGPALPDEEDERGRGSACQEAPPVWFMLVEEAPGRWWIVDLYAGFFHRTASSLGSGVRQVLEACDQGLTEYEQDATREAHHSLHPRPEEVGG